MEVRVRPGKGKKSEAFARFHRIICDQPFDEGGSDCGMTPPELMLASLGCCGMHYAAEYLRARNLPLDNIELTVSAKKGGRPVRLTNIDINVEAPGLSDRNREGLLRAVEACLIHRTLAEAPKITIKMATDVAETPITEHPFDLAS